MSDLILNPNLLIQPVTTDGRVTAYSLVAPVRGRGKLQHIIEIARADAEVVEVLAGLVGADRDVDVADGACATLTGLGVLVHEDEVSRPVRFSCRIGGDGPAAVTPLTVNPGIAITTLSDLVAGAPALARILEPSEQIALVTDPATGARHPYWIDDAERALLQRLVPGGSPPADLDGAELGRLARAGILVDEQAVTARRQQLASAAAQFARHGYAELPAMLPPLQVAALRRFYRDFVDEGYVADHDRQVELRSSQYNERLMQYYHHQLCACFARVVGQPIKPSYGYFSSYRRDAVLTKHVDRPQCQLTASLLLDYVAAPSDDPVWPLYLELPAGEQVAIELEPGGAVLYRGCELPHYRHALRGERSTSYFLHYVDEGFTGDLA